MASNESESRPLETVSTDDLLKELSARSLSFFAILISSAVESPDMCNWQMRYKGNEYTLIGLLFEAQYQLRKGANQGQADQWGG